ncbi:MAG: DUF547 domain-containing protein [Bacteroidota bacterium]
MKNSLRTSLAKNCIRLKSNYYKVRMLIVFTILLSGFAFAQPNHELWNDVLKNYVSDSGTVNYKDLKEDPTSLKKYFNELENNQPEDSWTREETLAYWINAYNAYTVQLILDSYPLNSIKDIKKPWDQEFIPSNQSQISLNTIEHKILRKMDEPRIHFAIVCASISCPKLSNTAFTAENLDQQLDSVTKEFLNDSSKNSFEAEKTELSKIFKWFAKDFKASGGVIAFVKKYKDVQLNHKSQVSYKTYDWGLNE